MRPAPVHPRVHLFVCVNRRDADAPLGPGCGEAGDRAYEAAKRAVAAGGRTRDVWVTRAMCLGICPKKGCTVAVYPEGKIVCEVTPDDAANIVANLG